MELPSSIVYDQCVESSHTLKSRRLRQISSLVLGALMLVCPIYVFQHNWKMVGPLLLGMAAMVVCKMLNRYNKLDAANLLLLWSVTSMISTLMWVANGLHDSALLAYPVILVLAGLLVTPRQFYVLLGSMSLFIIGLTVASEYGWRIEPDYSQNRWDFLRDVLLIFLTSGVSVWIIISDLQTTLQNLFERITNVHTAQELLTYTAQHDPLTHLVNRSTGRELITHALLQAKRSETKVAVLFVDLDNFKMINDSVGHGDGDAFLQHIAEELKASVRTSDIVSRHGGDEFLIGLTELSISQDVSIAANTILNRIKKTFQINEHEIEGSCSIGIAVFPDDGETYDELLRYSDIAMYKAKESGRNAFRVYDQGMHIAIQNNMALLTQLRHAITHKEFVLFYQPVLDLASNTVIGSEALIRWQHPERGLLAPGFFIEAAEKSGLIVDIGEWVLEEACKQLVAWQSRGVSDFTMALNLSPVQFKRGNIEIVVEKALKASGLNPKYLELEITESTLVQDTETFILSLKKLKALGLKISIDDFGTGYSNLSYLQRFDVDTLKIDQSFVMRLQKPEHIKERALINAIIQMAKSLNLKTTAEGIENKFVLDALNDMGCEHGQGYYFNKPIPSDVFFTQYLQKTTIL